MYMVNHGLSTGALFLCIGMIYDRYHTRDINELSGLARIMPKLAFFFVLFAMSSIGLPGLNGFSSEFLTILGAFNSHYLGIGFGSIAALFGLTHGLINERQYTELVTVVLLSAFVPTLIAQLFVKPVVADIDEAGAAATAVRPSRPAHSRGSRTAAPCRGA